MELNNFHSAFRKNSCSSQLVKWNFGLLLFVVSLINCIRSQSMKENELFDSKIGNTGVFKNPDVLRIYGEIIPHSPTHLHQNKEHDEKMRYTDTDPHNQITTSILQSFDPRKTLFLSTPVHASRGAFTTDKRKVTPSDAVAQFMFSFSPTQTEASEDTSNEAKQESSSEDLSTEETAAVVSFQPMQQTNPPQQSYSQAPHPIQAIPIGQTLSQAVSAAKQQTMNSAANSQTLIRRGGLENPQTVSSAVAAPIPVAQTATVAQPAPVPQSAPVLQLSPSAPTHAGGAPSFQISFDPIGLILGLLQAIPLPSLNLGGKAFFGVQFDKGLNFGSGAGAASAPIQQQAYAQRRQQPRLSTVLRLG